MQSIKTVILCGGKGYRLKEETEFKPKPMIEIGTKPILWHILKIYSSFGYSNFIIALGYKGNLIKDYFVNKKYYDGDFSINSMTSKVRHHRGNLKKENFNITFVDTGVESLTGERVRQIKRYVDGETFMVTYGDGLADINVKHLLKFHKEKGLIATVSGVSPFLKYGGFFLDKAGLPKSFEKKVKIQQVINGGFMVFEKEIFKYLDKDSMLEDVFGKLIAIKKLSVYQHKGFFHAMDTYQDMQDLNDKWTDKPAWKLWD